MTKKCAKHRRKAIYEWQICSVGKTEYVCEKCDQELNLLALRWRFPKSWQRRIAAYKRSGANNG